jgi:hypothetical protein
MVRGIESASNASAAPLVLAWVQTPDFGAPFWKFSPGAAGVGDGDGETTALHPPYIYGASLVLTDAKELVKVAMSQVKSVDSSPGVLVTLTRVAGTKLGLVLVGEVDKPNGLQVKGLDSGGQAEQTGKIKSGMIFEKINGKNIQKMTKTDALAVLNKAKTIEITFMPFVDVNGMFIVVDKTDTVSMLENGYWLVWGAPARKLGFTWADLVMHPTNGGWLLDGTLIDGVAAFAPLHSLIARLQSKPFPCKKTTFQLSSPITPPNGWRSHPSKRPVQTAAVKKTLPARRMSSTTMALAEATPAQLSGERAYLEKSLAQASFATAYITSFMTNLCDVFNATDAPADLGVEAPGFYDGQFSDADILSQEEGKTKLLVGPLKSFDRSWAKLTEDYLPSSDHPLFPKARYVIDLIRYTCEFASPLALASFFIFLSIHPEIKLLRVKNKLCDPTVKSEQQTVVLINAEYFVKELDVAQMFEIQLTFREFLIIKDELHTYYEMVRASKPADLLVHPIFKVQHIPLDKADLPNEVKATKAKCIKNSATTRSLDEVGGFGFGFGEDGGASPAKGSDDGRCECGEEVATVHCNECRQSFCDGCNTDCHKRGAWKGHTRVAIADHLRNASQDGGDMAGFGFGDAALDDNGSTASGVPGIEL